MLAVLLLTASGPAAAQGGPGPDVLLVVAHPDDEALFAGTVHRITHVLDGEVDLALISDGGGGFRYAYLAEPIYGVELTDEREARRRLPAVRRRELMASGAVLGLREYFFMDQPDHGYTENADTVLRHVWDADAVGARLERIMRRGEYGYVFVHLPLAGDHGHHVATSVLALRAASELPDGRRPVVLGSFVGGDGAPRAGELPGYTGLAEYPITRIRADVPPFVFDRTRPVRPNGPLNYRIVANWVIAEHKTQGKLQLSMNVGTVERFWYFAANRKGGVAEAKRLFDALGER